MANRALPATLLLLGLIALLGALALVVAARTLPAEGLQDLGRIVGAVLLAAASGLLFGSGLLVAGLQRAKLPRWLNTTAILGSLVALLASVALLQPGLQSGNLALAASGGAVALLSLAGLAMAPRAWRAA